MIFWTSKALFLRGLFLNILWIFILLFFYIMHSTVQNLGSLGVVTALVSVIFFHSSKYCLCKCQLAQLVKYLTKGFNKNLLSPWTFHSSINSCNWTSGVWASIDRDGECLRIYFSIFSFLESLWIATKPNTAFFFQFFIRGGVGFMVPQGGSKKPKVLGFFQQHIFPIIFVHVNYQKNFQLNQS